MCVTAAFAQDIDVNFTKSAFGMPDPRTPIHGVRETGFYKNVSNELHRMKKYKQRFNAKYQLATGVIDAE